MTEIDILLETFGRAVGEPNYPDFRDLHDFLSDLITTTRRDWSRHMTWVGSSLTALAFLSWLAVDLFQSTPELLDVTGIMLLALLIFVMIRYTDSLLPLGIAGLLRKASISERTSQSPKVVASYLKANLTLERERAFWSTLGDLSTNIPLLFVVLEVGFSGPPVGVLAVLIAAMRISASAAWLSILLAVANPRMLDAYVRSTEEAEGMTSRSTRFALFFFKLSRVGRLIGALLKTLLYGTQIAAVALLYVFFLGPSWPAGRLALVSLAAGFLGLFAYHAWSEGGVLSEATAGLERIRNRMIFRRYKSPSEITKALAEMTKETVRERFFPRLIPDDVMEAISGFGPED